MQRLLPKVAQSFLCLLAVLLFAGCSNRYYSGPVTDHFDGRKFDNPWAPMPDSFGRFLKWRLTADRGPWPESVPVITQVKRAYRLLAGFGKNSPSEVRLRYGEQICNDFELLKHCNSIRRITERKIL